MFRRVSRCLIRDFEPTRAWEDSVLEVDWAYDSGGRGSVDKEAYKLSWFQLADQWTPGISGDEYASFLESLLAQLAVPSQPPAVTGDTAGEPAAAGDDEHAAEGDGEWPATPEGLATPESEGGEESSLRLRDESALAYMGPAQGSPGSDKASPVEDTAGEEGRGGQGEPHVPSGDGDREGEGEDTPQQQQQQLSDTESPPPAAPSAGATKAEEEEAPPPVGPDKQVQVAVPVAARVARQDSLWMDRYAAGHNRSQQSPWEWQCCSPTLTLSQVLGTGADGEPAARGGPRVAGRVRGVIIIRRGGGAAPLGHAHGGCSYVAWQRRHCVPRCGPRCGTTAREAAVGPRSPRTTRCDQAPRGRDGLRPGAGTGAAAGWRGARVDHGTPLRGGRFAALTRGRA